MVLPNFWQRGLTRGPAVMERSQALAEWTYAISHFASRFASFSLAQTYEHGLFPSNEIDSTASLSI